MAFKEERCFYTDYTGVVRDSMAKVREGLELRNKENKKRGGLGAGFPPLPDSPLPPSPILGPLVGFFLLLAFGPWASNQLTGFIRQQIDSLASKPLQVYYHKLDLADRRLTEPCDDPLEAA